MKKLIQKFWVKTFWAAVRRLPWKTRKSVGARTIAEMSTPKTQITLIVWDMTNPKYNVLYSREELINMLALVRNCEREMGWKVPELEAL